MPLLKSTYTPPSIFKNAHFSTIYSAKIRIAPQIIQTRQRIELEDGDFIDLDWSYASVKTKKLTVLLHGLEGNAQRTYIQGAASHLNNNGWDAVAVNYRGCSGEPNKLFRSYNAGTTDDLEAVIQFILQKKRYTEIALNGFSLGGNLLLKYLGERENVPAEIKKAVAISTPLSLKGSLESLQKTSNWVYRTSFLMDLKKKYRQKINQFPEALSKNDFKLIKSLLDFDNMYTSKAHGFEDAYDYYKKNSSLQFLPLVKIPVLLLNAKNDSFLSTACYPVKFAEGSEYIFLESPKYGGHVGFYDKNNVYYSERRTVNFLEEEM
ncbi:MAG: alpha/beta fold hydrolase [Flavobacteriales bacterium]|jgi:predicted alpha/beta-fold hydrolase|nr:alpha/beta fold hydrolase [Flavobacteriales bacterium]